VGDSIFTKTGVKALINDIKSQLGNFQTEFCFLQF